MSRSTRDVSELLELWRCGRPEALDELFPLVYDELRQLASRRLRREPHAGTLQTTALVHEAYLRLVGSEGPPWNSRAHFFHAAAEAMRRILIEYARRRTRLKRGGDRVRIDLDQAEVAEWPDPVELLAVDEAIRRLEEQDGRAADVVRLRYFVGLSVEETGRALDLSERTVMREWAYARAWLRDALGETDA